LSSLISVSSTEKSSTTPIVNDHRTESPFSVKHSDRLQSESEQEERRTRISPAQIRERVKELQDQTGDLSETLERIEKRLEETGLSLEE
jgi:hypothetical protein